MVPKPKLNKKKDKFQDDQYSFKPFTEKEVNKVIFELPANKISVSNDIPMYILKQKITNQSIHFKFVKDIRVIYTLTT